MNLIFDKIHDLKYSYGRLLIPFPFQKDIHGGTKWLAYFSYRRLKDKLHLTDKYGFYNCKNKRKINTMRNLQDLKNETLECPYCHCHLNIDDAWKIDKRDCRKFECPNCTMELIYLKT